MKILIGLPIFQRSWIVPYWFSFIERQTVSLSDIGFLFECGPNDVETMNSLFAWHAEHPQVVCFDVQVEDSPFHAEHVNGKRKWNGQRYRHMVRLRNSLLDRARNYEPERYFSLDSDIFLEDPNTLEKLFVLTDATADAAAPLMYMTPKGTSAPSTMTWIEKSPEWRAKRRQYPVGKTFKTDVIMAAKMMSKPVYMQVDYEWHRQGEDIGWSKNATESGFELYCASSIYCPHIMSADDLAGYLINGDPRGSNVSNVA